MGFYKKHLTDFEGMFYVNATLGIIASGCVGSVAAMLILMSGIGIFEMIQLFLVVSVAMIYNAAVLAQMKPKTVFNSLIVSLCVSVFWILWHLAQL